MEIFAASAVMPISTPPIEHGAIVVDKGRIVDIGHLHQVMAEYHAPVTDFPHGIIMPGLVNAHTHLELTHFPSWKMRKALDYAPRTYIDWIIQVIKIKRSLKPGELELSLREGLRISLESGTVVAADILSDWRLLNSYASTPAQNILFLEAIGQDVVQCKDQMQKLTSALEESRQIFGLSPHAPHTLSPSYFQDIKQLASRLSLRTMTHLSESAEEVAFMHNSTGKIAETLYPYINWERYLPAPQYTSSAAYLDSLGVLDSSTIAVHCVHLTPADVVILRKRGVGIVICPRSNDRLAVGRAPVHLLKEQGIPLAIGTDSLASNDSLSLWDEMRFLLEDSPGVFQHEELLHIATLGGSRVLGIDKDFGSLEKGKRADFLVIGLDGNHSNIDLPRRIIEEGRVDEIYIAGVPMH